MKPPCDEAILRSSSGASPCQEAARPWILAATILGSSMAFIDSTVVNVALPALQTTFHATVVDVQWVVESYGILLAALILVGGSLGDLFGRRLVFLSGVVLFAIASVGCGVAGSIHQLIIARSVQGMGAALLVPGSLAIISTSFDEKNRGAAIGTWSGFTAITTAIGPVLGGWLVDHASWRWVFFLNVPLAVAVIVLSLWGIPESRSSSPERIDWPGAVLVTAGLGSVVFAAVESVNLGWGHPRVLGSLILGCSCLIIFPFIEVRAAMPMVPLKLFASRVFAGANLLTLFVYSAIGAFFFLFPLNLMQVQGYSATESGAAILPMILLVFVLSRWSGGLVARYGPTLPLIAGPLLVATGFLLFAVPSVGGSYWTTFFPAIIVLGLGMATTIAPLTTVVMNAVGPDRVGAASGVNNAVARLAGVLAIAVMGIVMVNAFGYRLNPALQSLPISAAELNEVHSQEIQLAGLQPPASIDEPTKAAFRRAVAAAFVFGFRMFMFLCAALSVVGAVISWFMICKAPESSPSSVLPDRVGPGRNARAGEYQS